MTKPRVWTTGDLKKVAELAGTMPERELRRRLKLSKNQLKYAVNRLRSLGVNVTTRYYEPQLETCPVCGCRRATLGKHGICEPCRLKRQLTEIEWRISDLMAQLTPEQRAVYEKSEAWRESRADPMPQKAPTDGQGVRGVRRRHGEVGGLVPQAPREGGAEAQGAHPGEGKREQQEETKCLDARTRASRS